MLSPASEDNKQLSFFEITYMISYAQPHPIIVYYQEEPGDY